jgi:DNA-directed RNA polymerase subunit K/omega
MPSKPKTKIIKGKNANSNDPRNDKGVTTVNTTASKTIEDFPRNDKGVTTVPTTEKLEFDYNDDDNFSDDAIEEADFASADEPGDGDVDNTEELEVPEESTDDKHEQDQEDEDDNLDDDKLYDDADDVENDNFEGPEDEDFDKDDNCMYKFNRKNFDDDEDEVDDEELSFEDDNVKYDDLITNPEDREAKPVLTKYERVRILGDRAKQISLGAKPMLLEVDDLSPKEIAKLELEKGVIPLIIEKVFPDGKRERWKVSELKIEN